MYEFIEFAYTVKTQKYNTSLISSTISASKRYELFTKHVLCIIKRLNFILTTKWALFQ